MGSGSNIRIWVKQGWIRTWVLEKKVKFSSGLKSWIRIRFAPIRLDPKHCRNPAAVGPSSWREMKMNLKKIQYPGPLAVPGTSDRKQGCGSALLRIRPAPDPPCSGSARLRIRPAPDPPCSGSARLRIVGKDTGPLGQGPVIPNPARRLIWTMALWDAFNLDSKK